MKMFKLSYFFEKIMPGLKIRYVQCTYMFRETGNVDSFPQACRSTNFPIL